MKWIIGFKDDLGLTRFCAVTDQRYVNAPHWPHNHNHMVLRWERNADSLHVALEWRMSSFTVNPGLGGDRQHWRRAAEAPGDARGSLVLLSV